MRLSWGAGVPSPLGPRPSRPWCELPSKTQLSVHQLPPAPGTEPVQSNAEESLSISSSAAQSHSDLEFHTEMSPCVRRLSPLSNSFLPSCLGSSTGKRFMGAGGAEKGFCLFVCLRAKTMAYGGSQTRGRIGAVATGLHHSHTRSELHT